VVFVNEGSCLMDNTDARNYQHCWEFSCLNYTVHVTQTFCTVLQRRVGNSKRPGRFHQAFACIQFAPRACSSVCRWHIQQTSRLVFTYLTLSALFACVPWSSICTTGCTHLFHEALPALHVLEVVAATGRTLYLVPPHGHASEQNLLHWL